MIQLLSLTAALSSNEPFRQILITMPTEGSKTPTEKHLADEEKDER